MTEAAGPPGKVSTATARRALAKLATLGADKRRGTLFFADFDDANLAGSRFRGVSFRWCSFRRAELNGSQFQGCFLDRPDLDGAELRGAYFGTVRIDRATFRGADLSNAVFHRCVMETSRTSVEQHCAGRALMSPSSIDPTSRARPSRTHASTGACWNVRISTEPGFTGEGSRAPRSSVELSEGPVRGVQPWRTATCGT